MTLVTGGTGFIGSHLVEKLRAGGQPFRCLVRRSRKRSAGLAQDTELVYGDLVSGEGLEQALRGVDTVIHLAGVTKALSTREYYSGNVTGTENLAKAIAGKSLRFVHVSSLSAVGPSAADSPVTEDSPPNPVTHYGRSKLDAERIVRNLIPNATIVRPPVVYGPRDTDVFEIFKSICKGAMVQIAGDEQWFQAIYVKDLADGLIAAAQAPEACGRTYFLAHRDAVSLTQFGSAAARIMGKRPRVLKIPFPLALAVAACAETWAHVTGKPGIISREKIREARYRHWTCDTRRAAEEIGFEARTSLIAGIEQTLPWYKEAGWLKY